MRIALFAGVLGLTITACSSSDSGTTNSGSSGGAKSSAATSGAGSGGSSVSVAGSSASSANAGSQAGAQSSSRSSDAGGSGGQGGGQTGGTALTGGAGQGGSGTAGRTGGTTGGGSTAATGGTMNGGQTGTAGQTGGGTGTAGQTGGNASGGRGGTGDQAGGTSSGGGQTGSGGSQTGGTVAGCVPTKTFGTFDPAKAGPFEVTVEKDVGPAAGTLPDLRHDTIPHFNVYRPKDLGQGYCHPIITWGNGTNDQPEPNPPTCVTSDYCGSYKLLVNQLASHGFVVVASLSSQTAKGDPLPQIAGVNWMLEENQKPSSAYYHKLDTSKIGASGHSQGGAATTMSGADERIIATVPICGSRENITQHGPVLLICGGADTIVPCSSVKKAFDTMTNLPVMMAEVAGVDHGSWIGSIQNPVMVGTTAWMRVHLMNDTANRGMFYGANCKWCSDSKVKVQSKMMDQ